MKKVETKDEVREVVRDVRCSGGSIGVVPTMGYLHEGHMSLVRRAREETSFVILTIFVNPTQFGPGEDLERYPRDLERDLEKARKAGVDLVFAPSEEEMYGPDHAGSRSRLRIIVVKLYLVGALADLSHSDVIRVGKIGEGSYKIQFHHYDPQTRPGSGVIRSVHLFLGGGEDQVHPCLPRLFQVTFQITRITLQILPRAKLGRVHKYSEYDEGGLLPRPADQGHMALVKVAHRGNHPYAAPGATDIPDHIPEGIDNREGNDGRPIPNTHAMDPKPSLHPTLFSPHLTYSGPCPHSH